MATKIFQPTPSIPSPGIMSYPSLTNPPNPLEGFWIISAHGVCLLNRSKKDEIINPDNLSSYFQAQRMFFESEIHDNMQIIKIIGEKYVFYAVNTKYCMFVGKSKKNASRTRVINVLREIAQDFVSCFIPVFKAMPVLLDHAVFELYNYKLNEYFSNENYVSRLAKQATKSVIRKVIDTIGGLPGKLLSKIGGKIRRS